MFFRDWSANTESDLEFVICSTLGSDYANYHYLGAWIQSFDIPT